MRRRSVLQGLGSALFVGGTGCLNRSGNILATNAQHDEPNADTIHSIEITEQDGVPDAVAAELIAEVVEPTVTTDHPAVVRITFTNTGTRRKFTFGDLPPFTTTESVEDTAGLLLLDPSQEFEKPLAGCWRPPPSAHAGAVNAVAKIVMLDRNASISREAALWGSPRSDQLDCLPTGEFRFERDYTFGFLDVPSFTWGFTVSLSEP